MTAAVGEAAGMEALKRALVAHYERQLERHGPSAAGMDWKDEASQRLRFRVLALICDLRGRSVAEVGCGAGHLVDHLQEHSIAAEYCGFDLSPRMIEAARSRHPGVRFECVDLLRCEEPENFDVVLCSGLFHVKPDPAASAWEEFVRAMLRRMWSMCRVGIGFNLMSDQVDYRVPGLHYTDPGATLRFCQEEFSRFAVVRHDYPLYEYTTHVYRDAPAG